MAAWPTKRLNVLTEVSLDPHNVRLEESNSEIDADIIADLVANEGVMDLIEGISSVGYLTHETPIVIETSSTRGKRKSYTVVEGNRRIAALKLIQNGMLASSYRARIEALSTSIPDRDALLEVQFRVAPDRDAADQLIAAIHTSNLRRAWTPARQAAFFQAQLDGGRSYQDLLTRYPTADVPEFVLYSRLRDRIKKVKGLSSELREVFSSTAWRRGYSTLSRIFDSRRFRALVEPQLTTAGRLKVRLTNDEFDLIAGLIAEGVHDGSLNTRSLNSVKSPRFTQLMKDFERALGLDQDQPPETPDTGSEGDPPDKSPSDPQPPKSDNPRKEPPEKTPRQRIPVPKRPRRPRYLPVESIGYTDSLEPGVKEILEELSILDVARVPNSTHLILRSLLERSVKAFADHLNLDIRVEISKKNLKYLQLDDCLLWLEGYFESNGPLKLQQAVQGTRSRQSSRFNVTVSGMNASNHNHAYLVHAEDVWELWNSVDPILREIVKR